MVRAIAAALVLVAGSAAAAPPGRPVLALVDGEMQITEPRTPCAGRDALGVCFYTISGDGVWLAPTSVCGGGTQKLPTPTSTEAMPLRYTARCVSRGGGWGDVVSATLAPHLTCD